jgi:hypothetical protein
MTMGMVWVACITARAPGVPVVTMMSGFRTNQFGRQIWQAIILPLRPSVFDGNVFAVDMTERAKLLAERINVMGLQRS